MIYSHLVNQFYKRDDVSFRNCNLLFLFSNIQAYGVYISQLIRYHSLHSYQAFVDRRLLLTKGTIKPRKPSVLSGEVEVISWYHELLDLLLYGSYGLWHKWFICYNQNVSSFY